MPPPALPGHLRLRQVSFHWSHKISFVPFPGCVACWRHRWKSCQSLPSSLLPPLLPGKTLCGRWEFSVQYYSQSAIEEEALESNPRVTACFVALLLNCSVVSDSLQPHELHHAKLPCPSLSPWVCSNSCPLSQWHHPTISSSVAPFSSCLQSFPASGSFLMSWFFASGGQRIGASAFAPVLSMNIQVWFPFVLTGLIFLLSSTTVRKHQVI